MSNNSVYTVTCDSTGKVVYPTNFTEANKISSGGDSNLEFYHDGINSNKPGWNTGVGGAKLRDATGEIIAADGALVEIIPSTKLTNTLNIDKTDTSRNKIKGWYITYIKQLNDERIELTLGTKQRTYADLSKEEMPTYDKYPYDIDNKEYLHIDIDALGLEVGDVLYMVNKAHVANALVVTERCDPGCGVIWCKWLPKYEFRLEEDNDNDFWNYSVWVCGSVNEDGTVTNHTNKIDKGWVDLTPNSLNIGANNFAGGYCGVTIGDSNEVHDAFSMTVGEGNQIVGYSNFTSGRNSNVINGEYSIACGHSTSVKGNGSVQELLKPNRTEGSTNKDDYDVLTSGTGCAVFGRMNSSNNEYGTLISGIRNTSYSSLCSAIFGWKNKNKGHYSIIAGTKNEIIKGESSAVFGNDNTITGPRCFALGQGLKGYPYQTIIGRYNEENADSKKVFIIGQGSSNSNRKNIFTVDKEGNLEAAGTGTFNNIDIKGSVNSDIKLNLNSTLKCAGIREGETEETKEWVVGNEFGNDCGLYFYGGTEPYSEYTKSHIFIQDGSGKKIRITPEAITFEDNDVEDKDDTYIKKSITIDMNSWNDILNRITALEALHPKS